jgi:LAO/AO transport system kinase
MRQLGCLLAKSTTGQPYFKNLNFLSTYRWRFAIKASAKDGLKRLAAAKTGDVRAFAQFLTWLEAAPVADLLAVTELWNNKSPAFRFGITGPPGAGKSTLVGRLIANLRAKNLKVGVMAVDPSSPFSKGAILGDRIRYSEHFNDPGVFIRSLGTRGSLGGLSSSAFVMARAFDVCEFDVLLIETVGVGQTELDILHVADQVCVVLVPESGDSIQAMKAGLMEIADIFVVNKADRPGADGLAREIEASIHDGESAKPVSVLKCVATENQGVDELAEKLIGLKESASLKRNSPARLKEEARALLRAGFEISVDKKLAKVKDFKSFKSLFHSL